MDLTERKIGLRVAAQHAAKQAVELALAVGAIAEKLQAHPALLEVDASCARRNIAAIRRELDDLEHLIADREPPIEAAPRAA